MGAGFDLPDIRRALAPQGRLRAAINFGNAVLARRDAEGRPAGVTVDLSQEIARRLGVPLEMTGFDTAARVVDALGGGAFDIGYLAVDPLRADTIDFTAPYALIEGAYIVREAAPYAKPQDLDAPGVRIAVGAGAAYDLFLGRSLARAALRRYPTSADALTGFLRDGLEAGANIRRPAMLFAAREGGLRVLDEPFMQILQAIALPRGRGPARAWAQATLAELKASGFVAAALAQDGQQDAIIAP
ncbi:MAG: transporter substrate-binding domain-containing protein [Rhizobiales bacterium]|nr:transporter substrate-binding domain-containing protein [Hyphomicrobiales bacterium]